MNFEIMMRVSGFTFEAETVMKVMREENDLANCLTTHLALERFIEAWICGYTEIEDLFINDSKNKEKSRFSLGFMGKAQLAQRMGLPIKAFRIIDKLNSIRNGFAHRTNFEGASHQDFMDLIKKVDELPSYGMKSLNDADYEVFVDFGDTKIRHQLISEDCPHGLRYTAICYALMARCLHFIVNELIVPQLDDTHKAIAGYKVTGVTYQKR
ncbi:hypothetical protein [Rahnella sp. PD4]|uniref:hypothetical protein n=1 Tax=Rahnella sp. PD4 TaxID=3368611 RepID=UPI003BA1A83B